MAMNHYIASVTAFSPDIIYAEVIPTDDSYESLDRTRPGIRFFYTTEGTWKAARFSNYDTGDEFFPPSCFKPRQELVEALEEARDQTAGLEGKMFGGTARVNFEMED